MWGLLLIGSQSSGNIRWLVTHSKYFANKVLCSTWHFFHGDNVICFVACNRIFVAFDAEDSNFKAMHGIVTNYTFHNLVGIFYIWVSCYLIWKNAHVGEFRLWSFQAWPYFFSSKCISILHASSTTLALEPSNSQWCLLFTQPIHFTTNQKHLEPKNVFNYEKVVAFQQPSIM